MSDIKLTINPRFAELCPPLTDEEREQLKTNLVIYGCREPLCVWQGQIVDGHNRYAICTENYLSFAVQEMRFRSEDQACDFIIQNQLGRRNLAPEAAALLRGKLQLGKRGTAQDNLKRGAESPKCQSGTSGRDTAQEIADQAGVSRRTVLRDAKFAAACDELGVTAAVMAGKEKRSRKEIIEAAASPKPAKTRLAIERKKPEPFVEVVCAFARLEYDQMKKALEGIERIWNAQCTSHA